MKMKKSDKIGIILVVLAGCGFLARDGYYKFQLHNCSRYTIGTFRGSDIKGRSNTGAYYSYFVNGVTYQERISLENNDIVKNGLIYLRFYCNDPTNIEGIWDRQVSRYWAERSPIEGWEQLPE
jgi:hypothetical protein